VASFILPPALPVAKASPAPSSRLRVHSGYAPPGNAGTGGYSSQWQIREGVAMTTAEKPITAVFLVDHETTIPSVALALQNSGAGAIVSEGPLTKDSWRWAAM
jgi:hypothetical protein